MKPPGNSNNIELTTYCNAICPQCPRYKGLDLELQIEQKHMSFENFKKIFEPSLTDYHFSGTYGDPGMHPELDKIVEHVLNNSNAFISISTNLSMRDPQFWWELGIKGSDTKWGRKRLKIIAAVDGINQKMHSKYRQQTNLKKILDNLQALSETRCKIGILSIIFKHNEDYIEQIKDMCSVFNPESHEFVESNRFFRDEPFLFRNVEGEIDSLEPARKYMSAEVNHPGHKIRDIRVNDKIDKVDKVTCTFFRKKTQTTHTDVDGFVAPCCHLLKGEGERYESKYQASPELERWWKIRREEEMNAIDKGFLGVINNEWYTKWLPEALEDAKNMNRICKRFCGNVYDD